MLNLLSNLAKAAVAVAVTPVAIVADVLTLPESSCDPHRGAFDKTAKTLNQAAEAFNEAVKPAKD